MTYGERLQKAGWAPFVLAIGLTAVGLVTIATASEGHTRDWAWLQLRWTVVGACAALLVLAIPYQRLVRVGPVLYLLGLVGLVLVLLVGTGQSAGRWIRIGSFNAQPSEFMKVLLILMLAGRIRYDRDHKRWSGIVVPLVLTAVPAALVMKQPDLGTALLFVPILFTQLYAAGARSRHLLLVTVGGLALGALLFFVPGLLKDYQKDRILAFLVEHGNSGQAAQLRKSQSHQLHMGKTAVGLGGFTGASDEEGGAAEAVRFLPERHTDFIFPVFAARFGFVGVTLLFLAFLLFLGTLLGATARLRDPSARMLGVGVFALFAAQIVVNCAMTVGLLPVVGVTLPFFSSGGSSLLTSFLALGLLLCVGVDPPLDFGKDPFDD